MSDIRLHGAVDTGTYAAHIAGYAIFRASTATRFQAYKPVRREFPDLLFAQFAPRRPPLSAPKDGIYRSNTPACRHPTTLAHLFLPLRWPKITILI